MRPCGLSGVEHLMLPRQQALRCFRRRSHFPSLQFGPADFPASNILCSPENRLCRVFGAAITLRPCKPALPSFRAQFGPADFPASNISCFPDSRPCGVFGAAITLRPCNSALRTFRRRTSYAPLTTGSAEFSAQQSLCAPAIRPCGLSGVEHLMLP